LKRRRELSKRKDPKTIEKRKNQKIRAHRYIIVTPKILPVHNCDPKNIAGRISEAAMGAAGYIFGSRLRSSEAATGGGGRAAPRSECP
jgi:hypothetical protein